MNDNTSVPMEHYNFTELLRGKSSQIVTKMANESTSAFILKNRKPMATIISLDKYLRLQESGIDINAI